MGESNARYFIQFDFVFLLRNILFIGYTESLTLDEQVTIIEQSWLDTLLLDIIERSLERNDDALQFAPDFIISR